MANKADSGSARAEDPRERRQWQRVLIDLEVDYGDPDNYLFAYIRDLSATGLFVRTHAPEEPGTRLNVRFTPPDGCGEPLELEGEVIWINRYRPSQRDSLHPGMGIRFIGLEAEQRHRLVEFVRTFAYLDDPDEGSAGDDPDDGAS